MKDQPAYQRHYLISAEQEAFWGFHDAPSPEHPRKSNLSLGNKNRFFEKSVLCQFESPILISSIPTLLSTFKFPSSLSKDQRNSLGEWEDGLREWIQLKQDGSWMKAGQDLILQQPSELSMSCMGPQSWWEDRCFLPEATVRGRCLRLRDAAYQSPGGRLAMAGGWLATSPSQGQQPCHFSKCPPVFINHREWGGGAWLPPYTF